jgi:Plasmid pRiA4b ORF-3-like protein
MTQNGTLIIRAALERRKSIYRDIEVEASDSLYSFAQTIVKAFGFEPDHAFGFYTGLTPAKMMREYPRYELFADMGETEPNVGSVKKTKVARAFPAIGHTMIFLFDYGDEWRFRVSLRAAGAKIAKVRYPRIVATRGDSPPQYPDPDELDDE